MPKATYFCLSCDHPGFTTKKGLHNHERKCDAPVVPTLSKRARQARLESEEREKRTRLEEDPVGDGDDMIVDIDNITVPSATVSSPIPEPAVHRSARSGRAIKFPRQYQDFLPASKTPLDHIPTITRRQAAPPKPSISEESDEDVEAPLFSPSPTPLATSYETNPNEFGVFRRYPAQPTVDPDARKTLASVCDSVALDKSDDRDAPAPGTQQSSEDEAFAPFSSATAATMMAWHYNGKTTKTGDQVNEIAQALAAVPVDPEDLKCFNFESENKRMDSYVNDKAGTLRSLGNEDGWKHSPVKIRLPHAKSKWSSEQEAPELDVGSVHHRDMVDVITAAFESPDAASFHFIPFEELWKPSEDDDEVHRIYGEAYTSKSVLQAYDEVNSLEIPDDEGLERVVASVMLASDSTHLTNFGTASLWPQYMAFGNQSKYERSRPTSNACHHMAYIPTLPEDFQEHYKALFGESASAAVLTHCKRELMHAVLGVIIDDKLAHAYHHGIVVRCHDGVRRYIFPRFFSYSADYPEK
ncbi:hypothetical protein EWM64_g1717 [Hericium alpestre]|uniref:Uncharacterized protein n=1 Tax=Hericium alpestre TaxID=135208 RepID=A0A4Z0A6C9_9AGAM|nr:hypothetical protein EWM64_g1717 [Hericium alpestre]